MKILCGSAGWTDKTLIACKRFYPADCRTAEARLRFYASQFPLVEVDSSYYGMPSAANSALWVDRTPADFTFDIKAFRLLTGHQTVRESLPKDIAMAIPETGKKNLYYRDVPAEVLDELWRSYREALEPLRNAGKLGAVLFQFAPWLMCGPKGNAHVEECADRMQEYTVAVEFRNESWLNDRHAFDTLELLRRRKLVHVIIDAPETVTNRAHTLWQVTNPELAFVRLHGRDAEKWNATGAPTAAGRFDYDYSDNELAQISGPIRDVSRRTAKTHVIFNNCREDQGQRNARTLMKILGR
ncbi:hypothetical protein CI15_25575 [Paraburkholderia monticola]|uniref:DUF72 domain-containing protein n=1 Tax=Paraburkholderia monticola TaxID=1399968 RepID=A0A149PFS9_9BURK|nr:DUF72 domain-containing protein [Paraburkholderia monticola]KXU83899.1 hypothetical protein CI15_25575 [Paraburkholderia monticola]